MKKPRELIRYLRRVLGSELNTGLAPHPSVAEDRSWDWHFRGLVKRSIRLGREVRRNRLRVAREYRDFESLPAGRRAVILSSGPPSMLLALAHHLMKRSYEARFTDVRLSLRLAELALETADSLERALLAPEILSDLRAEAWGHLANARRINSDLIGAQEAFDSAQRFLTDGTGDRLLKAKLLGLRSALEYAKGDSRKAGALMDREIRLWRLLGDRERLGAALFDRAVVACWSEPVELVNDLIAEAGRYAPDPGCSVLALNALAYRFARDGAGSRAWRLVCARDILVLRLELEKDQPLLMWRFRWTTGLASFALGELDDAAEQLEAVRTAFVEQGESSAFLAAIVGLDLTCVLTAQGRTREAIELAAESYSALHALNVERRASAALRALEEAIAANRLTTELAVRIANFMARYRHDKNLRFSVSTS